MSSFPDDLINKESGNEVIHTSLHKRSLAINPLAKNRVLLSDTLPAAPVLLPGFSGLISCLHLSTDPCVSERTGSFPFLVNLQPPIQLTTNP